MDRGEIVRVLSGPYDGGWYRVRYSGIVGYSIRTYLIHTGLAGARTARGYSRVVVISLARQQLEAYEHGKVWLVTPVTTGRPELPTPAGSSRAGAKLSPYTFVSPWPEGSPFYYEPSRVRYALRFRAGGYYIHDAPWRRFFGFGTDKVHSTASGVRTGSHGCVNVPPGAMRLLFDRVTVDTAIVVVRR
jgi:lipoprotein-anchoring transpeptidase ErfK/SrfK